MTDAETGGRRPHPKGQESEPGVTRNAGDSPMLRWPRQPNVQFSVKTPIALLVIGICPITTTFVAPTTKSGGTEKTASEANRRVPLARIRFRRCLLWCWTDASRPHWKRRASPWVGWTPSAQCRPTRVRSLVVAFARRRSSQHDSGSRGCC